MVRESRSCCRSLERDGLGGFDAEPRQFGEFLVGRGLVGQVGAERFESDTAQVQACIQRAFDQAVKVREVIRPGGRIIVTTMQCFPLHGFPDDYYRYSESGLRLLLEDAGFVDVTTASAGEVVFKLDDHGNGIATRKTPMHVFAVARVPEA